MWQLSEFQMPNKWICIMENLDSMMRKHMKYCSILFSQNNVLGVELKIENVDFHLENNRRNHRTNGYDDDSLIVRRGQEFSITVNVNRAVDTDKEKVSLRFKTGQFILLI